MADNFNADGGTALDCGRSHAHQEPAGARQNAVMMYGRPSANYQFPASMWLLPGGLNGWFAARDFQGLNQEHIS